MTPALTLEKSDVPAPFHPLLVLEEKSIAALFQPVVSVQRLAVAGLENVGRAFDPLDRRLMEPRDFFRDMDWGDASLRLALDRLFRQKGMELFSRLQPKMSNPLLFLNIDSSILDEKVVGSGYLLRQAGEQGLDPRQLVLQISVTGDLDLPSVEKFIRIQRRNGFLISIKDVNTLRTRLESVFRLRPDILKLEDRMARALSRKVEKQDDFLAVVKKAHALGVSVMVGGLESEEDALKALEYGADLLQGGYFTRNYDGSAVLTLGRKARMMFLASRYHRRVARQAKRDRDLRGRCESMGDSLFALFQGKSPELMERGLSSHFPFFPALECLYLLDGDGRQASETVCNKANIPENKRFLYRPAPRGADHSLREYYYALSNGQVRHVTDPRLSTNSGNLCVTYARVLENPLGGDPYILCSDWNCSKI